jgi:hypothetical protein
MRSALRGHRVQIEIHFSQEIERSQQRRDVLQCSGKRRIGMERFNSLRD